MLLLTTQIEIQAPPAAVRAKFLDFNQIPIYSPTGFFRSLSHAKKDASSPKKEGKDFVPGDKMHNVLPGMTIEPVVLENSPQAFLWRGSLLGIFIGAHAFRFLPSSNPSNLGGTTFVHEGEFSGILAWTFGENWVARWIGARETTRRGFESYNADLKAWCEKSG